MDTLKQQKRKEKIKELLDKGSVAFIKHLFEIEETIDELDKKIKPLSESQMEMVSRIVESVVDHVRLKDKGEDGKDGEDYILTDEDKEEIVEDLIENIELPLDEIVKKVPLEDIAKLVKVPVVEKVIEKTEVIKEVPIVTNEVKEVAKSDTPEQTRDKLESLEEGEKLTIQAIQDLPKLLDELRSLIVTRRGTVGGGLNSMALQSKFIDDETISGTINGVNQTFTLANTPIPSSVKVYRGGARQRVTEDYTLSGRTITFTIAPEVGEVLLCDYRIV